jgi:hypothetical protein
VLNVKNLCANYVECIKNVTYVQIAKINKMKKIGVRFKKEFIEKVRNNPDQYKDPKFVLSDPQLREDQIEIKIHGLYYEKGDIEFYYE